MRPVAPNRERRGSPFRQSARPRQAPGDAGAPGGVARSVVRRVGNDRRGEDEPGAQAPQSRCGVRAVATPHQSQPWKRPRAYSSELLGESDDDALRATQEAEPVDVLVLRDLADEFGTVAAQARDDVVDVVDSEHDAAYAERV